MTVAELKAAQADAPDGVGQVPHGIPRDYNFAADVLQKNLTVDRAGKSRGEGMLLPGRGRAAQGEKHCPQREAPEATLKVITGADVGKMSVAERGTFAKKSFGVHVVN